ncbi:MAG: hypothetical protein V4508_10310 [Pseudomonadota bacterium]
MEKERLVEKLQRQLDLVAAERRAAQRAPQLQAARGALKRYQAARLARTHADLLARPDTGEAAAFFLEELYGAHDLSQRDIDLRRIIPTMQRVLSYESLHAITEAIVLDALSEKLDSAMARTLGEQFDDAGYGAAYRSATGRAERERQLELVQQLGDALCVLVRVPLLSLTLSIMRTPARLAGLGQLQQFLERGFGSFKKMRQPAQFVATIVARERAVLARLYEADPAP